MDATPLSTLATLAMALHWQANLSVFTSLLGAMVLGFVVGYERSYHGRAAGMRTYGLVCMASAALTITQTTRSSGRWTHCTRRRPLTRRRSSRA